MIKAAEPCTYSLKKNAFSPFIIVAWYLRLLPLKLICLLSSFSFCSTVGDSPDGGERLTFVYLQCL